MSMSNLHSELLAMHERLGQILGTMEGRDTPRQPPANGRPPDERFDAQRKEHRWAAEAIFKDLGIDEKRQGWFYNKRLHGEWMSRLRSVIETEDAAYHRMFPRAAQASQRRSRGDGSRRA